MKLTEDEMNVVRRAKWQERIWPVQRVVLLVVAFAALGAGFKLMGDAAYLQSTLRPVVIPSIIVLGVGLLVHVVMHWQNDQRQLLLRLSADTYSRQKEQSYRSDK